MRVLYDHFSALTPIIRRLEEHPICKNGAPAVPKGSALEVFGELSLSWSNLRKNGAG